MNSKEAENQVVAKEIITGDTRRQTKTIEEKMVDTLDKGNQTIGRSMFLK